MPSPRYLDVLCLLYRTRPDRLGFGHDYSDDQATNNAENPAVTAAMASPAPTTPVDEAAWLPHPAGGGDGDQDSEDEVERRQLLRLLSAYGGSAVSVPLFDALRKTRLQVEGLLETQSVSAATVDNWESIANNYGHIALTAPPFTLLAQTMSHLAELQRVLSRRQPLDFQKRLYRVMAQLAGLIAIASNSVGQEGQEWFHTARLAADETGDRALRAWVLAYEAMSNLWYGRPVTRAVELSRMAQAIAGTTPSAAGALAAAMEARAQARLGRRQEAQAAIRRSDAIFDRLNAGDTAPNIFGLSEHLLRMCQENALMFLGDTPAALAVQHRSFEVPGDVIDAALVKIDQSICYIRSGEPDHGCRLAMGALDELRPESRRGIPVVRARQALGLVRDNDRSLTPVKDLHDMLRDLQQAPGSAAGEGGETADRPTSGLH